MPCLTGHEEGAHLHGGRPAAREDGCAARRLLDDLHGQLGQDLSAQLVHELAIVASTGDSTGICRRTMPAKSSHLNRWKGAAVRAPTYDSIPATFCRRLLHE